MLTFKQVKENIASAFLNELSYMSKEINDDIIIEIVKNDIYNSISKNQEPTWWRNDFDGLTENDTLLKCIQDFEPIYSLMFKQLFNKYNDYRFENAQDFVYKILKDHLDEFAKSKYIDSPENVKLYCKMLDNIYKKNKDLSIFKTKPKNGNLWRDFNSVSYNAGSFVALYEYGFLKCDYKYDTPHWEVVKLK